MCKPFLQFSCSILLKWLAVFLGWFRLQQLQPSKLIRSTTLLDWQNLAALDKNKSSKLSAMKMTGSFQRYSVNHQRGPEQATQLTVSAYFFIFHAGLLEELSVPRQCHLHLV